MDYRILLLEKLQELQNLNLRSEEDRYIESPKEIIDQATMLAIKLFEKFVKQKEENLSEIKKDFKKYENTFFEYELREYELPLKAQLFHKKDLVKNKFISFECSIEKVDRSQDYYHVSKIQIISVDYFPNKNQWREIYLLNKEYIINAFYRYETKIQEEKQRGEMIEMIKTKWGIE